LGLRIPKKIKLPFGRHVEVYVSDDYFKGKYKDCNGVWEPEFAAIYIKDSLTPAQKRYTLYHELVHAVNDIIDDLQNVMDGKSTE